MIYYLVGSNLAILVVFIYKFKQLPPQLPLFYSKISGEDQLADAWMIILLPLLVNFFIIVNNYIYRRFFPENLFVKNLSNYFNLFIALSLSLIFIKIIFLVT